MRAVLVPPSPRRFVRPASSWSARSRACALILPLAAQSISPPIAEYQERARSSFQLINSGIFPLNVVLEVRGFRVTEQGEMQDPPLDTSRVHVKLSTMSFRIAPRGTYNGLYEAKADSSPAWFNILCAMTGARTERGSTCRILLPHVCTSTRKSLLKGAGDHPRFRARFARGKLRVQLENLGARTSGASWR